MLRATATRARAYDPAFARFLNRDSFGGFLGLPSSANRYAYALGNPVRDTDPSGHLVGAILADPRLVASIGLQMIPGIGDAYSLLTGIIGSDPIAGIELNDFERGIAIASAVTIGGGFHLLGHFDAALPGLRAGDSALPGGARVGRTLDEFTPAGRRAVSNAPPRGPPRPTRDVSVGRVVPEADPSTVRRFVRATEYQAIERAIRNNATSVRVGRYFTSDLINDPAVAIQRLALGGTEANPIVGYIDVPLADLPSGYLQRFGPRLVPASDYLPGLGLEYYFPRQPVIQVSSIRLVSFGR